MTTELIVTIVVMLIIVVAVIALAIVIHAYNEKYRIFVSENSVTLSELRELNNEYHFYTIKHFDMSHSYDNENFYGDISCQDYLTYELVYKQKEVSKALKDTLSNKINYEEYSKRVDEIKVFGVYTKDIEKLKIQKLRKTESKLFLQEKQRPQISFGISVTLSLTNIQGRYRTSKHREFDAGEIKTTITKLNQKQGKFYINRDIWDAICRVERGKVTNKMRFFIYNRDHNRCRICGRRTNDLEIDHIYPIAKGGKTTMGNLQTLCHRCNVRKGDSV